MNAIAKDLTTLDCKREGSAFAEMSILASMGSLIAATCCVLMEAVNVAALRATQSTSIWNILALLVYHRASKLWA